jgi:hypothetical protein
MLKFLGFITGSLLVGLPAYLLWTESAPSFVDASPPPATLVSLAPQASPQSPSAAMQGDEKEAVSEDGGKNDLPVTENPFALIEEPLQTTAESSEAASSSPLIAQQSVSAPLLDTAPAIDSKPPDAAPVSLAEEIGETSLSEDSESLHLLWSPFRSEAAAQGFAKRLSHVSGVDVRVAEAKPGRYRVGFHYPDEVQKNWYIGQIQARTGLDLGLPSTPAMEPQHEKMDQSALAVDAVVAKRAEGAD